MAALKRLAIAVVAVAAAAAPARGAPVDRWAAEIAEASARFGLPQAWIRRVMAAESGGKTLLNGRPIESRAGALGLMQLMPETWREVRAAYGLGPDPQDPRDNILAGAAYLRVLYDRFGYPGLFAAYNAGPARYGDHLTTGRRLPAETVAYVAAVTGGRARWEGRPAQAAVSLLFVDSGRAALSPDPGDRSLAPRGADALFVSLGAVAGR